MSSEKPAIVIHRDSGVRGARLRFSHSVQAGSLSESPTSKLPYVRIGDVGPDSSLINDSTLIIRSLIRSHMINDLNVNLSPSQKAVDLAIRALLEDKLYFMTLVENNTFRLDAWTVLNELLAGTSTKCGSGWILGGKNPTESDACLHSFLAPSLTPAANPEIKTLVAYAEKVYDLYFSDYKKWIS